MYSDIMKANLLSKCKSNSTNNEAEDVKFRYKLFDTVVLVVQEPNNNGSTLSLRRGNKMNVGVLCVGLVRACACGVCVPCVDVPCVDVQCPACVGVCVRAACMFRVAV